MIVQIRPDGIWGTKESKPEGYKNAFIMQPFQPTEKALTRWREGFLEFEDETKILLLLFDKDPKGYPVGTELDLDLDCEVVEQVRYPLVEDPGLHEWYDLPEGNFPAKGQQYRKVLRIINK